MGIYPCRSCLVLVAGLTRKLALSGGKSSNRRVNFPRQAMLAGGADVNGASADGDYTALHLAAVEGHVAMMKALLEAGADLNLRTSASRTNKSRHVKSNLLLRFRFTVQARAESRTAAAAREGYIRGAATGLAAGYIPVEGL
eukprot:139856-Prorocentrum_minimum.AAC.5